MTLGRRDDIASLYAAADFLISGSAFGEGFSNSIVEAMASELPVIATNVGDSKTIVATTGVVIEPKDRRSLEQAIKFLSDMDSSQRRQLGLKARKRVVENYLIDKCCSKFSEIYLSC